MSDYVSCLNDQLQTCHELVRESMDVGQERQKTYYDRSTFGPQYEVGDLVMVFNPTMKTGQSKKFKYFYSGPQVIREKINDLNFVVEDVKTKKNNKRSTTIDSNVLTVELLPLIKKSKKAKSEPRIPQNYLMEDNDFVGNELVTQKLIDTGRREVNLQGKNSQINYSTETHNGTVKEELFETPMGGSTKRSINTNTNNKSRSKKISATKIAKQQKRDSLVATSEKSEGEEFPNRSTVSTSQNATNGRYQTRSASGITIQRKLKDCFLFKDNDSDEKFDNDILKFLRQSA